MEIKVYTKPNCSHCDILKNELNSIGQIYESINILEVEKEEANSVRQIAKENGQRMMPIVFIDGSLVRPEDVLERIKA